MNNEKMEEISLDEGHLIEENKYDIYDCGNCKKKHVNMGKDAKITKVCGCVCCAKAMFDEINNVEGLFGRRGKCSVCKGILPDYFVIHENHVLHLPGGPKWLVKTVRFLSDFGFFCLFMILPIALFFGLAYLTLNVFNVCVAMPNIVNDAPYCFNWFASLYEMVPIASNTGNLSISQFIDEKIERYMLLFFFVLIEFVSFVGCMMLLRKIDRKLRGVVPYVLNTHFKVYYNKYTMY